MSVQTEINRLNSAKTSLITSIRNKGVTVSNSVKLEALSTYVDAIQIASSGICEVTISNNSSMIVYIAYREGEYSQWEYFGGGNSMDIECIKGSVLWFITRSEINPGNINTTLDFDAFCQDDDMYMLSYIIPDNASSLTFTITN